VGLVGNIWVIYAMTERKIFSIRILLSCTPFFPIAYTTVYKGRRTNRLTLKILTALSKEQIYWNMSLIFWSYLLPFISALAPNIFLLGKPDEVSNLSILRSNAYSDEVSNLVYRILKSLICHFRIQNKDAEAQLLKAEKSAAAAFEAAHP
jgi:hypothetical protein